MDTSKRPRASHTWSANRSNHSSLVPVGGAAALPTERLPVTPAVVEGTVPVGTVRQIVLPQHTDSAAAAAAELSAFGDWSDALGALVPSSSTLGNAVAFANAWTEQRKAAERWLAYARENETLAWNHALGLIDVVKTPLVFATERDAALADALPATLRLVRARTELGRKAARTAAIRRRAVKPAAPVKPEAGAKAPGKEAPMPIDLATIHVVPGAQHAPIRPARRGPFCILACRAHGPGTERARRTIHPMLDTRPSTVGGLPDGSRRKDPVTRVVGMLWSRTCGT